MSGSNYSNPWREKQYRAEAAVRVRDEMAARFPAEIRKCAMTTNIFPERPYLNDVYAGEYAKERGKISDKDKSIHVVNLDSVSAAYQEHGTVAILNFASYKNPGGMFLEGSIAQEESLCHESALYNILSSDRLVKEFYEPNRRHLNRALYHDNLLYTSAVPFVHNGELRYFDVITCAAPNKGAAQKYQHVSDEACAYVMRMRIRSVLMAAIDWDADVVVLGAFGCGVFKNDPETVARLFKSELEGCPFKTVFAVPGDKYAVFKKVLEEEKL